MKSLLLVAVLLPAVFGYGERTRPRWTSRRQPNGNVPTPLCIDKESVVCPSGYINIEGACYKFMTHINTTWDGAVFDCLANDGYLASIRTPDQMSSIVKYINEVQPANGDGYWTGASDEGTEGTWYWRDGSPVTMGVPFWGVWNEDTTIYNEPTGGLLQNCAFLFRDFRYYMYDKPCSDADKHPLCEAAPVKAY